MLKQEQKSIPKQQTTVKSHIKPYYFLLRQLACVKQPDSIHSGP
jgi:hypothetical protein